MLSESMAHGNEWRDVPRGSRDATGDAPENSPLWAPRLKRCATPQCQALFPWSGHRHCCSPCGRTGGITHARRCKGMQRALACNGLVPRHTTRPCSTPGCTRGAGSGFRVCCSCCRRGRHGHRCDDLWQGLPPDTQPAPHSSPSNSLLTGDATTVAGGECALSSSATPLSDCTLVPGDVTQPAPEASMRDMF